MQSPPQSGTRPVCPPPTVRRQKQRPARTDTDGAQAHQVAQFADSVAWTVALRHGLLDVAPHSLHAAVLGIVHAFRALLKPFANGQHAVLVPLAALGPPGATRRWDVHSSVISNTPADVSWMVNSKMMLLQVYWSRWLERKLPVPGRQSMRWGRAIRSLHLKPLRRDDGVRVEADEHVHTCLRQARSGVELFIAGLTGAKLPPADVGDDHIRARFPGLLHVPGRGWCCWWSPRRR